MSTIQFGGAITLKGCGTAGCVFTHIPCALEDVHDEKESITKVTNENIAINSYRKYQIMKEVSPNVVISNLHICKPGDTIDSLTAINMARSRIYRLNNPYFIQMSDGGISLQTMFYIKEDIPVYEIIEKVLELPRPPIVKNEMINALFIFMRDVATLHMHGIVHEDINLSNVMWNADMSKFLLIDYEELPYIDRTVKQRIMREVIDILYIVRLIYACRQDIIVDPIKFEHVTTLNDVADMLEHNMVSSHVVIHGYIPAHLMLKTIIMKFATHLLSPISHPSILSEHIIGATAPYIKNNTNISVGGNKSIRRQRNKSVRRRPKTHKRLTK